MVLVLDVKYKPAMVYASPHLNHYSVELSAGKLKRNSSMNAKDSSKNGNTDHIAAQTFSFRELANATRNFRAECLLGEGGFGRVYKGHLENINQVNPFLIISLFMMNRRQLQGNEVMLTLTMSFIISYPCSFFRQPD